MKKSYTRYLILLVSIVLIAAVTFILFRYLNNVDFSKIDGSVDLDDYFKYTSNILTFSALLIATFSALIGMIGIFTYKNLQKTENIKKEAQEIIKKKEVELHEYITRSINSHFIFFSSSLRELLENQADTLSILFNGENNSNLDLSNYEYIFQKLLNLIDAFANIQSLYSIDKERIEKALFYFQGRSEETLGLKRIYLDYIEQFIKIRNYNEDYKEEVYLAKKIREKYLSLN